MTTDRSRRRGLALSALVVTPLLAAGAAFAGSADLSRPGGATRLHGDQTSTVRKAVDGSHARHVIVMIGDGMGDSEITSARNDEYGADGRLPGIDALPLTGQYTTFSLTKDGKPDYVTDSAASGTGWATGTKTYDGAISVDIRGKAHKTLLELAKAEGLRTGDVTTAEIEDATPAVLVSHVTARSCYGPVVTSTTCPTDALENGGRGSIAEQLLRTRPDVTLGGGAATLKETAEAGGYQGRTLLQQADQRGYRVVTTASGLAAVNQANRKRPVLGAVQRRQPPGAVAGPAAGPAGAQAKAARCTPNPEHTAATPGLPTMTTKAIQLLDDKRSDKGFLLQVEGGQHRQARPRRRRVWPDRLTDQTDLFYTLADALRLR